MFPVVVDASSWPWQEGVASAEDERFSGDASYSRAESERRVGRSNLFAVAPRRFDVIDRIPSFLARATNVGVVERAQGGSGIGVGRIRDRELSLEPRRVVSAVSAAGGSQLGIGRRGNGVADTPARSMAFPQEVHEKHYDLADFELSDTVPDVKHYQDMPTAGQGIVNFVGSEFCVKRLDFRGRLFCNQHHYDVNTNVHCDWNVRFMCIWDRSPSPSHDRDWETTKLTIP